MFLSTLAVGGALITAGCLGDTTHALSITFSPELIDSDTDLHPDQRALIEQANTATVAYQSDPLEDLGEYVQINGSYYRLESTETDSMRAMDIPTLVAEPIDTNESTVPLD